MKFEFECLQALPQLSWSARFRKDESSVHVLYGSRVEIRENCFIEGAWNGPFESFDFDRASTLAGSGARIRDGYVVFAGPSHVYDRLYTVRVGDELFLSNSLAFLLALSGERLDPNHPHYFWDFLDFLRIGIKVKEKRLRLDGPRFVKFHDCCNLRIGPDLVVTRLEKPIDAPPRNFKEYQSSLIQTLRVVIANAGDPARILRYRPVTMLSQGYDSTAVSALASQAGCREAVTFRSSGGKSGYEDDSGAAIAQCLGLSITEYERRDAEKLPDFRPDEFYIEPWGNDREVAVMEPQLAGSLLLSGRCANNLWPRQGGRLWGPLSDTGRPDLQDADQYQLGGAALGEFRLRTGFIDFPPASRGAIHAPIIHAIGQSKGLQPWSQGGDYDKPIARRIAEEAGVPRHLFGQTKKGGPARQVPGRKSSRIDRLRARFGKWMPVRILYLWIFGNRRHPRWREGSFAVQRCMDRAIERYSAVLAHRDSAEPARSPTRSDDKSPMAIISDR